MVLRWAALAVLGRLLEGLLWLRLAINSQLRTGTDSGNPTV